MGGTHQSAPSTSLETGGSTDGAFLFSQAKEAFTTMNQNITTNLITLDLTHATNGLVVLGRTMGYEGCPTPSLEIALRETLNWVMEEGNQFTQHQSRLCWNGRMVTLNIISDKTIWLSGVENELVRDCAGKVVLLGTFPNTGSGM